MNRDLPKAVRDALARQTAAEAHPSTDALTAFVERSLPPHESRSVTDHLVQCADCREVVFLASNAVEESVEKEEALVAAAAALRRVSPALLAKAAALPAMASAPSTATPRRRRWRWLWMWVPAGAVLVIVAGVVVQNRSEFERTARLTMASRSPMLSSTAEQQRPAAADERERRSATEATAQPTTENRAPLLPAPTPLAKSARAPSNQPGAVGALAAAKSERKPGEERHRRAPLALGSSPNLYGEERMANSERHAPAAKMAAAATPSNAVAPGVTGAAKPPSPSPLEALLGAAKGAPPAASTANSFAENEAESTASLMARPQPSPQQSGAAMRSVMGPRPQWRLSPDGHLEHLTAPGSWTPVLADQPTTFHVVSVVGSNVWAGGSGGALFHSRDGGQNWSQVALASLSGAESGTIVAIRFSDAEHGVVTTDGGAQWSTSDGGATWTKQ